ncbi:CRE-EGRH-3 protein [Caenorhabditis remanei]|uniref:CRE-EGRH-3 protein n=1 Tax=Caenorhabditis remanei TaxID=31234 RepID=E3NN95_CAERE|nr:CRE-EGRH-3 protein [Caenorhabditis remanei]
MLHTQSEPQTSFGSSSQHMQQQRQQQQQQHNPHQNQHQQLINHILHATYADGNGAGFLNPAQQKFDFLPNLQGHPPHLMQNGGGLNGNQQRNGGNQPNGGGTNNGVNTPKKNKKGQGPGRRPALDANGMPKERPFVCPRSDCQKRFCRNDHLQRHMRIHTGQRLFQCRTCLRSFSRSDHLAKHERTHSADKPYSCLTCARRFHKHEEKKKHEEVIMRK